ncbi:1,2-phenylacetyl-CoA epoxidase subunit PaaB [Halosimplex halobium]|uniref:1,2-phenylacetyl-CoA epoxidase subunit PaaB n=1 Tax=Halosimplex halobium TaxID=3396618 RepID=UPI003F551393
MRWEVFRQESRGDYHRHCGDVHAPDRELAALFARIQHGRRMTTESLWVVPSEEVTEVDADDAAFGGRTDKAYRWATTYNVDATFAEEVADSEREQAAAEGSGGTD